MGIIYGDSGFMGTVYLLSEAEDFNSYTVPWIVNDYYLSPTPLCLKVLIVPNIKVMPKSIPSREPALIEPAINKLDMINTSPPPSPRKKTIINVSGNQCS